MVAQRFVVGFAGFVGWCVFTWFSLVVGCLWAFHYICNSLVLSFWVMICYYFEYCVIELSLLIVVWILGVILEVFWVAFNVVCLMVFSVIFDSLVVFGGGWLCLSAFLLRCFDEC